VFQILRQVAAWLVETIPAAGLTPEQKLNWPITTPSSN
jgi:hypothetical protein